MWENFIGKEVGVFFRGGLTEYPRWFKFEGANNNGFFVAPSVTDTKAKWKLRFYPWGKLDHIGLRGPVTIDELVDEARHTSSIANAEAPAVG